MSRKRSEEMVMGRLTLREYLTFQLAQGYASNVSFNLKSDCFGNKEKEIAETVKHLAVLTANLIIDECYGE